VNSDKSIKIAIGPVLFGWPERKIHDFYLEMAELSQTDILYLGEIVCAKRSISGLEWLLNLAEKLAGAGKEIVLSTLAMPTTEAELQSIRELASTAETMGIMIEANDMAAVAIASGAGAGFVAGPHLNIYNNGALGQLCQQGAKRVVLPLELPAEDIADVIGTTPVEVEYFSHGRLPLTFSARCYAARAEGLSKQSCQHVCFLHPDGIGMRSLDGADFATINGTQIMSDRPFTALNHVAAIAKTGVNILRLSPQASGMHEVVTQFSSVIDGAISDRQALHALAGGRPLTAAFCNGYYHGRQGRLWIEK